MTLPTHKGKATTTREIPIHQAVHLSRRGLGGGRAASGICVRSCGCVESAPARRHFRGARVPRPGAEAGLGNAGGEDGYSNE